MSFIVSMLLALLYRRLVEPVRVSDALPFIPDYDVSNSVVVEMNSTRFNSGYLR